MSSTFVFERLKSVRFYILSIISRILKQALTSTSGYVALVTISLIFIIAPATTAHAGNKLRPPTAMYGGPYNTNKQQACDALINPSKKQREHKDFKPAIGFFGQAPESENGSMREGYIGLTDCLSPADLEIVEEAAKAVSGTDNVRKTHPGKNYDIMVMAAKRRSHPESFKCNAREKTCSYTIGGSEESIKLTSLTEEDLNKLNSNQSLASLIQTKAEIDAAKSASSDGNKSNNNNNGNSDDTSNHSSLYSHCDSNDSNCKISAVLGSDLEGSSMLKAIAAIIDGTADGNNSSTSGGKTAGDNSTSSADNDKDDVAPTVCTGGIWACFNQRIAPRAAVSSGNSSASAGAQTVRAPSSSGSASTK